MLLYTSKNPARAKGRQIDIELTQLIYCQFCGNS